MSQLNGNEESQDRRHFTFEKNLPTKNDPETGILIPDLENARTVQELQDRLNVPFTNDRGVTRPWLSAYMEALRIVLKENLPEDIDGSNDYCGLYAGNGANLLRYLHVDAAGIEVENKGYLPHHFKQILSLAFAYGEGVLPPNRLNQLSFIFFDEKRFLGRSFEDILKSSLYPHEIELLTNEAREKLRKMYDLLRSQQVQNMKPDVKKYLQALQTIKVHASHSVCAFSLGGELGILDINQDQNPAPELYEHSTLRFVHEQYGINPLKDAPLVLPYDEAIQEGYYPQKDRSELVDLTRSPNSVNRKSLTQIFTVMKQGTTVWDNDHKQSELLRRNSLKLSQKRKAIVQAMVGRE